MNIETMISTLSETLRSAQVTKGFSEVLDKSQLYEVEYRAIRLSTAVTEYLAKAIKYLSNRNPGMQSNMC